MPLGIVRAFAALALAVVAATPAAAQSTGGRAEELAREQAEKAAKTREPRMLWIERKLLEIEEGGGLALTQGYFLTFGDIKQGSGFAVGPSYAKRFGSDAFMSVKAAYSIRNFKMGQLFLQAPPMAGGRLLISGRARWQDAPGVAVFGLGMDSPNSRVEYAETKTEFSGQAMLRPVRFLHLRGGAAYERFDTGPAGSSATSVEEVFTPDQMPGIGADPDYLHSFVGAGIDSTDGPGYSRRGTMLLGALHNYRQASDGPFTFQRVDGIARQLIPILRGNMVFDLSVRASTTSTKGDDQVPFFLMPDLGGGSSLRGYGNYRFRDRHSILFTAEYRWYVQEFVDMAIFYDAGKVTARRSDLDLDNLKSDVGIGIRFHAPQTTAVRIELAKGDEGLRFIFAFSPSIQWGIR